MKARRIAGVQRIKKTEEGKNVQGEKIHCEEKWTREKHEHSQQEQPAPFCKHYTPRRTSRRQTALYTQTHKNKRHVALNEIAGIVASWKWQIFGRGQFDNNETTVLTTRTDVNWVNMLI
eukprot:g19049.t1